MAREQNPSVREEKTDSERRRIPMSVPVQKLEVPAISGFHLHWFNGTPDRIQRALDAGYEFVEYSEVRVPGVGLGGDSTASGNTDMGSRVSVVSGQDIGRDGQAVRLILMKIREEWYEEDQQIMAKRNEQVAASIRGGSLGAERDVGGDAAQRYLDKTRTAIPDLFKAKRPKTA